MGSISKQSQPLQQIQRSSFTAQVNPQLRLARNATLATLIAASLLFTSKAQADQIASALPPNVSLSTDITTSTTPTTPPALDQSFFHRLGRAYVADWAGNGPASAIAETRRETPAPIPSPPYPSSDWPIGTADGQTYPLMQAINGNKSQDKIYGCKAQAPTRSASAKVRP